MTWAFFGTDEFSITVLETLKKEGLLPDLIVTVPDRPKGRKLIIAPPLAKVWAQENNLDFVQPESLKNLQESEAQKITGQAFDFFLVASYGKIIPQTILDLPTKGTLNIHPSLLPQYRGSTPIESAILNSELQTGVTIMLVDAQMDHGPILGQETIDLSGEETSSVLANDLAQKGAILLAKILPAWLEEKITPVEQNHELATFTKKIAKEDGQINLEDSAILNYRRYRAFQPWPGVYATITHREKPIRINIKKAHLAGELFIIERVTPEGKKEMSWEEFQRGIKNSSK